MSFQIGDQVVHWNYGLGEIIQLDEKVLSGRSTRYYVVRTRDLTIWVPIDDEGQSSLRMPTPKDEFENLFAILSSPGEPLSVDRFERKTQLFERMKEGRLESICAVVRDLTFLRLSKRLNDNDVSILERAKIFLLNEWKLVWSVSFSEAEHELILLLAANS